MADKYGNVLGWRLVVRAPVIGWWLVVRAPVGSRGKWRLAVGAPVGSRANWHSPRRPESRVLRLPIADGWHVVVNNEMPIVPNGAAVYKTAAKVHAAPIDVRISAVPNGVPEWIHHIKG